MLGTPVFHRCGGLDVGLPASSVVRGSKRACVKFDIAHEVLDAAEDDTPFPRPSSRATTWSRFISPVRGSSCRSWPSRARQPGPERGAEIHGHERVLGWEPHAESTGSAPTAPRTRRRRSSFPPGRGLASCSRRKTCPSCRSAPCWAGFPPRARLREFQADRLPIWIVDAPKVGHFYGFPIHGVPGFKLGRLREVPLPAIDPDLRRREPDLEDEADMRSFIREIFPDADGPILSWKRVL